MGHSDRIHRLCRHHRHPHWCRTGSWHHVRRRRCEHPRLWPLGMALNGMLVNMVMEEKGEAGCAWWCGVWWCTAGCPGR